jgi:hypothetical protein
MPQVLCVLERIGGISANKVYFRRIEDVQFDVSWHRGERLLKLSRHADVLAWLTKIKFKWSLNE